jgi:hypothetical protein
MMVLILTALLPAQWSQYQPDPHFALQPALQDSVRNKTNFYRFAGNIAGLTEDENAFSLQTGGNFSFISGDYRLPFDPQKSNGGQYYIQLVKPLTVRDIFKGYFGYQRLADYSVMWLHQTRLTGINTILLADSSTGDFILSGLFWNGEWAHQFSRSLITGLGIYYNVDQRLKQIFPKPENSHRDIHLRLGGEYNLKKWRFGLSYRYFNEQEKVEISRYNLDQNLTPLLFKFRFSDLPVILRGKTSEERLCSYHGSAITPHFRKDFSPFFRVLGKVNYASSRGKIVDGGSQPQDQGQFRIRSMNGKLLLEHKALNGDIWQFIYDLNYMKYEAEPPEFSIIAINRIFEDHHFSAGIKKILGATSTLFCQLDYLNYHHRYEDGMTGNLYDYRYHAISLLLATNLHLSHRWDNKIWGGIKKYFIYNKSRTENRYSEFFDYLFIQPYAYFTDRSADLGGGLQFIYHYGPVFDTEFSFNYLHTIASETDENFHVRHNFLLTISLKFFII